MSDKPQAKRPKPKKINRSLVVPIYMNEENIPTLMQAIEAMAARQGAGLEVIFVVDGSPDKSGQLLLDARKILSVPSKIIFHSRNFGSFTAIRTGLEYVSGEHIAVMAADLQEPPELIDQFFEKLQTLDVDLVMGQRVGRDDPFFRKLASNLFWSIYRRFILPEMPAGGVDVFACNKAVKDSVLSILEPNSSLIAQLFWVGYRREFVPYTRRKRVHGTSAWDFRRRMRYMMDSIFSYSDAPLMAVLWIGLFGCVTSFLAGLTAVVGRLMGWIDVPGYVALLIATLFMGSSILATQGIIGIYIWRSLENSKRRPLRIIGKIVE